MKKAGILLLALSVLIVFLAFNMDFIIVFLAFNTDVIVDTIGLLSERQNIIYLSGVLFLSGVMLFGFGFVAKEEVKNIKGFVFWTFLTPIALLTGIKIVADIQEANRQEEIRIQEKVEQEEIRLQVVKEKDGVVVLKKGLMWQRCSIGQTWTGTTCDGNPTEMDWDAAMNLTSNFAGYTDWRLPTKDELITLVYCSDGKYEEDSSVLCTNYRDIDKPTINSTYFLNAPNDYFWSSSRYVGGRNFMWSVDFRYGSFNFDFNTSNHLVRLVRTAFS